MNRSATVMLQLIKFFHREKAKAEKSKYPYPIREEYMHDYIMGTRQFYCDDRLLVSFSRPQFTEFTLDGEINPIPYPYKNLFEKFRSNSVKIVPPSVGILNNVKKEYGNKATIAIYLGDRETSIECKDFVKFSVDLLQKILEMIPKAEMYLFSNFTDEYSDVYGTAYFKNEFGDEGILAPMNGVYFDAILMQDRQPLWRYEDYKKFEKAQE